MDVFRSHNIWPNSEVKYIRDSVMQMDINYSNSYRVLDLEEICHIGIVLHHYKINGTSIGT
jgi:hypothetical protein